MPRVQILGVPIDALRHDEALDRIASFLREDGLSHVMTPNPEMLVHASHHDSFRGLLNRTSLNLPDGAGLLWANRSLPERVTGTDMMIAVCNKNLGSVFLLGAAPGIAETAADVLQKQNPSLKIVGTYSGSPRAEEEDAIVHRINASGATILFVAFGSPLQDEWIDRTKEKFLTVKVAMGVGGAFDFIAGKRKRAPMFLRKIGLEWIWRLIQEPSRFKRIFTAVIVFPIRVLTHRST